MQCGRVGSRHFFKPQRYNIFEVFFVLSDILCIFAERMIRLPHILLCLWALCMLIGCESGEQQRLQLEQLEQQNRAGEQLLNDSLAEDLVEYFDRHGDANERMRAKYMLGRTYYHLGELPRALETYLEAADCADTTDKKCDYKVLCRIYAQKGAIYHTQVQPRSQIKELITARQYAEKAKDTMAAVECYAQLTEAYKYLKKSDSAIIIAENASIMFELIGRKDRAAQILGSIVTLLVDKGRVSEAKRILDSYEVKTGFFNGNIQSGREIYYYVKGRYYLSVNKFDSAEYLFRKELRDGKDLNNQIAGCKGLQELYEKKKISDSIAKYANWGYILNDSAYSLSEMQNIQKLQASYNYNHQQFLAEKNARKAERTVAWLVVVSALLVVLLLSIYLFYQKYKADKDRAQAEYRLNQSKLEEAQSELLELRERNQDADAMINKKSEEIKALQKRMDEYQSRQDSYDSATLEDRIDNSEIVKELNALLELNPVQSATQSQMRELKKFVNEQIPCFYESLNEPQVLRPIEYEVCVLTRCHFKPASICKLLNRSDGYIANLRKGILLKVYGIKGSPKDLDERIMKIV
jgi:hypothetical protein